MFILSLIFISLTAVLDWFIGVIIGVSIFCIYLLKFYSGVYYGEVSNDTLSFFLILISFLIIILIFYVSNIFNFQFNLRFTHYLIILSILGFLYVTFSVKKIIMFYIFFEASLIPIFLLVLGWGSNLEKLQSGVYMLMYTLRGSLPLLIFIIIYSTEVGDLKFFEYTLNYLNNKFFILGVFILLAFLVKIPLFGVHLWLPKAHVEAPVTGSIILAGVMLKMGGYGLMRLNLILKGNLILNNILIRIPIIGGVAIGLKCLKQVDLKILVAYSSVVHIGLVVAGLICLKQVSWKGRIFLMLGHGFCSSCIFFLLGVLYDRFGRRSSLLNKGVIIIIPTFSFWWFISCVGNMSNPPRLRLFGEVILISSIIRINLFLIAPLVIIFFLGSCYSIYLFSQVYHGVSFKFIKSYRKISLNEILIRMLHVIPLNFIFLILK